MGETGRAESGLGLPHPLSCGLGARLILAPSVGKDRLLHTGSLVVCSGPESGNSLLQTSHHDARLCFMSPGLTLHSWCPLASPHQQHQAFLPGSQWGRVRCGPGYHFLKWVRFLHLLRLPGLQSLFTHVGLLSLSAHRRCARGFVDHTVFLLQDWGVS